MRDRDRRVFLLLMASLCAAPAVRSAQAADGPKTRPALGRKAEQTTDACPDRRAEDGCAKAN